MQQISHKEYEHVFEIWDKFEMITIKDYHDFYLKLDVSLLADVFQNLKIVASNFLDHARVIN